MPTAEGETAFHAAVQQERPDLVCRLLTHGALSHLPNHESITPLDEARALSDQSHQALIESGTCLPAE